MRGAFSAANQVTGEALLLPAITVVCVLVFPCSSAPRCLGRCSPTGYVSGFPRVASGGRQDCGRAHTAFVPQNEFSRLYALHISCHLARGERKIAKNSVFFSAPRFLQRIWSRCAHEYASMPLPAISMPGVRRFDGNRQKIEEIEQGRPRRALLDAGWAVCYTK